MRNATIRRFLVAFVAALFFPYGQAKSLGNATGDDLWQPTNTSMDEWNRCRGMPPDQYERTQYKYQQLQEQVVKQRGLEDLPNSDLKPNPVNSLDMGVDGCILLTEEQVDAMLEQAKSNGTKRRRKRTLTDFKSNPFGKWPMPVSYKFDGSQSDSQKQIIRNAFQHWMDNTCIRFNELATDAKFTNNHILLTSFNQGCYSYVGRTSFIPQPINLYDSCLFRFGTPVHEIGHTLGLWHEQMRRDRDDYITIAWSNIYQSYVSQFNKVDATDGLGLPYNFGSVMQYASKEGVSINGEDTMIARDPLYQMNMGQRTGLSFHDIKLMNLAYCQDTCKTPLRSSCQRGGFQNPNDCSKCICPDGFSGTYCENIAPAKSATCGGTFNFDANSQQIISSPGFDDRRYYFSLQECNWYFKAPANYKLQLTFDGDFGIYCENGACYHWVEVKFKRDLGEEGGRFCCTKRPSVTITSESNEMLVLFRSNYTVDYYPAQRGFKAIVRAVPASGDTAAETSSTTTIPTTTTTRTTTTTTPTTTTTTPTTRRTTISRTTPPTTSSNCERQDLAFVLDSSDSVGSENWPRERDFVNSLISQVGSIGSDGTRVAVTTFGSSASNVISFTAYNDISGLRGAVSTIPFQSAGGRDIAAGLQAVRTQVFAAKRAGVRYNCVLVIGGAATQDADRLQSEADQLRNAGIGVTVVAVGPLVNGSEAAVIAGRKDSGVVFADSFNELSLAVDDTARKICGTTPGGSQNQITLWQCSFDSNSGDNLCGATQDTTDQFDWTVYHDPTPSDPTGPDFPYDGYNYIFIEASDPRQPNDEARLFLPRLNFQGDVCVDFYYHMYGFHINILKLVTITNGESTVVWMRSKQIGNFWLHASVGVYLTSSSQLQFVGIRGNEYSGDIGLDKITVTSGSCPN